MIVSFQKGHNLPTTGKMDRPTALKIGEVFKIKHLGEFLGQVGHESGDFTLKRENMNYKEARLKEVFPYYASRPSEAKADSGKGQVIANKIYADKNRPKSPLGNTQPNDGWYFRGNASLQLTGRSNHKKFENWLVKKGLCKPNEIMLNPDLVWQKFYFESAVYYFEVNKLWDIKDVLTLSRAINLGNRNSTKTPIGLADRKTMTAKYNKLIA